MSIRSVYWRVTLALGAAAAAVLALAVPVGASTGSRQISPEQAGYTATGAQFKVVDATFYLRNPRQYASVVAGFGHSVQLWSSGVVVTVGVTASTSGKSYTPYATIYDRSTHQVIASNPNAMHCPYHEPCSPGVGPPVAFGDQCHLRISYSPATGHLDMWAVNPLFGSYGQDFEITFSYTVSPQSFTQARVGTDFGSSPWDASYKYTPPATPVKMASYNNVRLRSYNGHTATLWSWWVHHKLLASTGQQPVAAPHNLYDGGASFQTWFVQR